MNADNANVGRNFGMEMDEVKGKMNELAQAQNRMEDTLKAIRDSLSQLTQNQGERNVGTREVNEPIQEGPHTNVRFTIPIGEGYHPVGDAPLEGEGSTGQRFEQPRVPNFHQTTGARPIINNDPTGEREKAYEDWMEKIEEQLKTIRGADDHGSLRIEELCHATNVVIPKDFKVPDFSKYDGSGNPWFHLVSYATKMAMWSREDGFLICFFHESLTGPALEWYLELDLSRISRWTELADLFMDQYKFNVELTPTREQLGAMQKKRTESFREYAIRWRGLAVQVQPKMTMREMCLYFMGTLGTPYIGIMAGVAYKDFRELMDAGDRIEMLTKAGKLSIGEGDNNGNKKSVPPRKKETEVNQVHQQQQWTSQYTSPEQTPTYQVNNVPQPYNYTRPPHTDQPRPYVFNHTNPLFRKTYNQNRSAPTNAQAQPNRRPNTFFPNLPPFPKLAISNAELFQQLVDRHLLAPYPVRPIESNFPHWYNANLTCSYHMDVAGHSIEDCEQFKMAVRKLMACGKLEFEDEVRSDISKNPISNHNQRINVIAVGKTLVKRVSDLRVSMQCLFDTLNMNGYDITAPTRNVSDEDSWDLESHCDYHHGQAGHSIENCWGQGFKSY
ncbi:putative retrotransposon gag domain-containing protein [Lupinus albus]|uniref:Putative retrotransposon gag domain-containing protein n=1 Tax=Lupinus albus TaxID=3870 RepID=A0A6A4QW74_LUPAL|nr:putative retrotransposon gag domain-containing protein [Lupinus albus]